MKIWLCFFYFLIFGNAVLGQTKDTKPIDTVTVKDLKTVEKPAEFPGGSDGWRSYLEKNLKYPKKAQRAKIEGVVRVQFIVDKTGVVSELGILSEPGGGLGEEVIRLISSGPKWIPAEQNGKKVSYRHIQAITFRLE